MLELLRGIRTSTLNSKSLRHTVFELVGGAAGKRNPRDREVLELICDRLNTVRTIGESIDVLASEVCRSLDLEFDLKNDLELGSREDQEISEKFWRKVVSCFTREPWVFICNYAENTASAVHNDVFGITYGFHENVTTWRGLVASGPGTFIIFYNTNDAPHSKMSYSSFARIEKIEESKELDEKGRRRWKAKLSDFHMLSPVPESKVEITGRNLRHGIQAVTFDTFRKIIEMGEGGVYLRASEESDLEMQSVAEVPFDLNDVLSHGPSLDEVVPDVGVLAPRELDESMSERESSTDRAVSGSIKSTRKLDKQTETQAVEIALAYLNSQGWELLHDNQLDGIGYDFEFTKDGQSLLIEIKGIRGSSLEFNMTAREFFVCSNKENFRLIAVTNALKENSYKIHVLCPSDILQMRRRVTQYRLSLLSAIG